MTNKETIHISVASNDNYVVLMAALIKSIIYNHHTEERIIFYVLNDKISKRNQVKINSLNLKSPEIEIKWFNADEILPLGMKFPIDNTAFPFTTFLRLFAPYIVPRDVQKIIYFDVDMIVRGDVSELWNFDLKGHTLAAVQDIGKVAGCEWGGIPNYKQLGIPSDAKYFNSGLLIIDTMLWRENEVPKKVFDVMVENMKFVNFADQYGLNIVYSQKWLEIDPLWNWFANEYHPNPKCIHYLDIKPIFKSYNSDESFKDEFFKYLDMTPWKGISLQSDYVRLLRKIFIKTKKKFLKWNLLNA